MQFEFNLIDQATTLARYGGAIFVNKLLTSGQAI